MGFTQSLWLESQPNIGIGEGEYEGKWNLSRISGKNPNQILGLERRNTKENGIYPESVAGILTQCWEKRNYKGKWDSHRVCGRNSNLNFGRGGT